MTRRSDSRGWIASALFGVSAAASSSAGRSAAVRRRRHPAAVLPPSPRQRPRRQTCLKLTAPARPIPRLRPRMRSRVRTIPRSRRLDAEPQSAIDALRARDLRMPIDGAAVESMRGGFDERRDAGARPHEAADLLAPRNTPVHAVDNGSIAKLFVSKAGGNTIYQFDPGQRFCYYYAHLDRYADGLRDGAPVTRGDVIGFVGTSGNAPANTPHLHFALFELTPERHWWQGTPLDPYLVFRR